MSSSSTTPPSAPQQTTTKRIVVVGAGPAGLLSCIFLLRRNLAENNSQVKYQVTLVDPGLDYGKLDSSELQRHRSWMIGLSSHGLTSIKQIPNLFENYIKQAGIGLTQATTQLGPYIKFNYKLSKEQQSKVGLFVDRNYICGGLAKYLNDNFGGGNDDDFVTLYNTKALFVDSESKCVMIRNNSTTEEGNNAKDHEMIPLEYDYILGCDGVRSIVRNAFITNHRNFEFDIQDSFGYGKAVHIPLPLDVEEGHFMMLFGCLDNMGIFILPEPGRMLNFAAGCANDQPCHRDMLSNNPKIVEEYMKNHFSSKAPFQIPDLKQFAELWVDQKLSTQQFVHCNFYHSTEMNALLMGDAAHATVPNIGQGMNTALEDAYVLNQLLDQFDDDWSLVLPEFSKERVKEGNALTDLSFHTFSLDPKMQLEIMLRQNIRSMLNKIFPYWLVEKEPMGQIGLQNKKLSWAYNKVTKYGYLPKSRQINDNIKRQYFEKQCGMVVGNNNNNKNKSTKGNGGGWFCSHLLSPMYWLLIGIVAWGCYELGRSRHHHYYNNNSQGEEEEEEGIINIGADYIIKLLDDVFSFVTDSINIQLF